MAVTATLIGDGESHTSDEKGIETFTREWSVVGDAGTTPTFAEILTAVGVTRYQSHPQRDAMIARSHSTRIVDKARNLWRVSWTYSNAPLELTGDVPTSSSAGDPPDEAQSNSGNATARLPTISFTRRETQEVLEKDAITDEPVANTADEPFDPPIQVPRSRLNIAINYKSILIDVPHVLAYLDTVNDAEWNGFPAGTLRVVDFQMKTVYENYQPSGATEPAILRMTDVTISLEHKKEGWGLSVLNRGRRTKVNSYTRNDAGSIVATVETWQAITDDTGQPVQEPVPLKADGTRATDPADFHYLNIAAYEESDFDNLIK